MNKQNQLQSLVKTLTLSILISLTALSCVNRQQDTDLQSLLAEMINRESVVSYPSPAFTCKQFSSYDQNSVAPDEDGWFANHDASWFIRQEENSGRREFVMLDADGPGALVRFWMTFGNKEAYTGTIRFYFDGSDKPEIEGPVLDIISGGALIGEPLSSSVSPETDYYKRGHNLYLPLPYAGQLKVTYECPALNPANHSPSVYYNIDYRTYEEGTVVKSFTMDELTLLAPEIEKVQQKLSGDNHKTIATSSLTNNSTDGVILNGESSDLSISGKKAIHKIQVKIDAEDLPQALRSTVIEITFDGEKTVWSPVGEFFGTGYQIRPSKTWYTEVTEDGTLSCFWMMPFKKSAEFKLINYGDQPVTIVKQEAYTDSYRWNSSSMHFGATWKELREVETGGSSRVNGDDGHIDVNYVTLTGEGIYMGTGLTIFNTADSWWGEGDEKIWVDGESFPSFIGTGTEDYFGYAWCRPEKFSHFLLAQPDGAGNFHPGMTVNLRYNILDGIPFTQSLQFDLELWHWTKTIMNYAPMSFWYLKPGGSWNIQPDIEAVKYKVSIKKAVLAELKTVDNGILEGENLRILEASTGSYQAQLDRTWGWSNDSQLFWIVDSEKANLKADFLIEEAGSYKIQLTYTKAIDYGNFKIAINDKFYPSIISGYHNQTGKDVITQKVNLGIYKLEKGNNTLSLEVVGKHQNAAPRYMVGIDLLKLKKIEK